jgi:hypothetical protein
MGLAPTIGTPQPGKPFGMHECRRYITSHNDKGKAIYLDDSRLLWQDFGTVSASRAYAATPLPIEFKGKEDVEAYLTDEKSSITSQYKTTAPVVENGISVIVTNLGPGSSTGMHRTVSFDCCVCVEGHIGMKLDSGEIKEFFPGVCRSSRYQDSDTGV